MTWTYRVLRREIRQSPYYTIIEVFDGKGWCEAAPWGSSLDEVRADIRMMKDAFKQPVLTLKPGTEELIDDEV